MLKAILFDLDQTLVDTADGFRLAESWLQREMHARLPQVPWETLVETHRATRSAARRGESPAAKTGQWQEVCRHFGLTVDGKTLDTWERGYWRRVATGAVPVPGAMEILAKLRERFLLGLVTNAAAAGGRGPRSDDFPELAAFFQSIVICGGDDLPPKPDPTGFRRALADLGVMPEEAVFVGDNWETDIAGARAAGIPPIWLRHAAIPRQPASLPPGETIPLLTDLAPLVRLTPDDTPPFSLQP